MSQTTVYVCFDINSTREENQENQKDNSEDLMENPIHIFNNFFTNHKIMLNMEKEQSNASELNYQFTLNLPEKSLFQITTINDLSYIHEISLNADGFIIFINLEDEKTIEKLKYIIHYIVENCNSINISTYVVGMYKDKILKEFNKEKIINLLNEDNFSYEYFQIKYTDDKNGHFCFFKYIDTTKYNNKNFFNKKIKEFKFYEILEKIIIDTYEDKMGVIFDPKKRKFVEKPEKKEGNSISVELCNIL